ncbi:hypothetical protein [Aeromonas sp. FDAARGOS 1402]|uniref:hypothetical protein n=1 Tax=Aeromonas sp. FDAARGOS 1402 TaxID=2778051 RepID=UPI001C24FB63|nr:hypothetical protein [Aeromonas sp. FDAARGOS 1402]QWZ56485.1 hypothetical protein I6L32_21545 [Aeromonas sp. FDAARGOS 1402]
MLAGSHRNAWPDETGTGGRTNRNTQVPMNWDMSYPEMAKAIQGQLQALDLDSAEASAQVEGLYCMMELIALINQKQPGDNQAKQRHVQRGAFKK